MEKKHYYTRDRAGYSATLDAAGMAALNPRASGNGALLLDVSRRPGAHAEERAFACMIRDWGPLT